MTDKYTYRDEGSDRLPEGLRTNPFQVPDGYFEELTAKNLLRAKLNKDLENSMSTPESYFEEMQDSIFARIAEEKLKGSIPESGHEVPVAYFDTLSDRIMSRVTVPATVIKEGKATPVRTLGKMRWLQYAAAACILFAVGISTYLRYNTTDVPAITDITASTLNNISDQEILSYLELYGEHDDFVSSTYYDDAGLSTIDTEDISADEIEAYLNNTL